MTRRELMEPAVLSAAASQTQAAAPLFSLPKLPYAYDAVEPYSDAQTMQIHHDKLLSYCDGHLSIDFDHQSATLDAECVALTPKEYGLLALLVQHAGKVIPREVLLLRVWGYESGRMRTLDVHVWRVRKKLGAYSYQCIETIFGIGYRFQPANGGARAAQLAQARRPAAQKGKELEQGKEGETR